MNARRGFTLIEVMIVMAVLVVLSLVAVPAISGGLEATRAAEARAHLLASLQLASHRAIISSRHAVLCPSGDGRICDDGFDWSPGWIVFLDRDEDRQRQPDEPLLQRQPALRGRARLLSTAGRTRVVFQGNGSNSGSNLTWTLCDGRGADSAKTLVFSNIGRLREGQPSAAGLATCLAAQ